MTGAAARDAGVAGDSEARRVGGSETGVATFWAERTPNPEHNKPQPVLRDWPGPNCASSARRTRVVINIRPNTERESSLGTASKRITQLAAELLISEHHLSFLLG